VCPFCDSFNFNRAVDKLPFLRRERQRERGKKVLTKRKEETTGRGEGNTGRKSEGIEERKRKRDKKERKAKNGKS
jgi:hypothetical protein